MAALTPEQLIEVVKLYGSGLSAQQVANYFSVSLRVIYRSLQRQGVTRRSSAESNLLRYEAQALSYSVKENLTRDEQDLKLAAIMLYWAEGYKVGKHGLDFANSDPDMVVIFRKFLTEICAVNEDRIRCALYCYEGQDIQGITDFWSQLLAIPQAQFTKPYIKVLSEQGSRGPRMLHGLVHLRYSDRKLLRQILVWIDEYKQICVGGGVVNRIGL